MIPIHSQQLFNLYGKDLILFGTGRTGKIVALYLEQMPGIRLLGVTNSRVTEHDGGTFLDTGLPVRSIQSWAKLEPAATILITVTMRDSQRAIIELCQEVGFQDLITLTPELMSSIAYAQINAFALPQETFLRQCEQSAPLTGNPLLNLICFANELCDAHKAAFSEFRACHTGKDVVVMGTGPSMRHYSQISGIPHIGVNAAFTRKDIKLDYYFLADNCTKQEWLKDLKYYDCVKFLGHYACADSSEKCQMPESVILENHGRKYFFMEDQGIIHLDIEHHPIMGFHSIIFSALHFAIYTHPRRILLVGCDCSSDGHFDGFPSVGKAGTMLTEGYKKVKHFVERFYPDIEIISVNPVGLKGMFHDVYTQSYLEAHPEIDPGECEILMPAE